MSGAVEEVALLPCPFCGSCDVVLVPQTGSVECIDCGAIGPGTLGDDCAALWNTRTAPPARSYADAIEDAAKVADDLTFGIDIGEWLVMTKKDVSARACHECAAAIRLLSQGEKA